MSRVAAILNHLRSRPPRKVDGPPPAPPPEAPATDQRWYGHAVARAHQRATEQEVEKQESVVAGVKVPLAAKENVLVEIEAKLRANAEAMEEVDDARADDLTSPRLGERRLLLVVEREKLEGDRTAISTRISKLKSALAAEEATLDTRRAEFGEAKKRADDAERVAVLYTLVETVLPRKLARAKSLRVELPVLDGKILTELKTAFESVSRAPELLMKLHRLADEMRGLNAAAAAELRARNYVPVPLPIGLQGGDPQLPVLTPHVPRPAPGPAPIHESPRGEQLVSVGF